MLRALIVLIAFQLCGEVIASLARLPIPGSVIGMALLVLALVWRGSVPEFLQAGAGGLLHYLPLLFVPAGVGIIAHLRLVAAEWLPITVALIASTVLTLIVTAAVMLAVERWINVPRRGVVLELATRRREGRR
jgi:holin-like protein